MEVPWLLESGRHPRLFQTIPVGIPVGGSVGQERPSMVSVGSPLSSLDIVGGSKPTDEQALRGSNHVITPSLIAFR